MRGTDRLQKILYLLMAVLGIYIFYKGGSILLRAPGVQQILEADGVQRALEDAAVRTWAPGYAASVEQPEGTDLSAAWMREISPAYSYLADGQARAERGTEAAKTMPEADGSEATEAVKGVPETDENEAADKKQSVDMQTEAVKSVPEMENDSAAAESRNADMQSETAAKDAPGTDAQPEHSLEETETTEDAEAGQAMPASAFVSSALREQLRDFDYLLSQYYTVDGGTTADENLLDADALLSENLTLPKNPEVPQILIYHTHAQEAFADSREGETADTIVGMGEVLAGQLRARGYQVIHDTGVYDLVDGVLDRSAAYDYARAAVENILQEHPTIEVVIDLHRDGVEGQKFVTKIDGRPSSMIMFFNGISRDSENQPLSWLENPYVKQNLAFSLQLELAARQRYPGYTRNIYLKAERFNLHLRPRSLLVEAGTQLNTVEEEKNAMLPLAELLAAVLEGENA